MSVTEGVASSPSSLSVPWAPADVGNVWTTTRGRLRSRYVRSLFPYDEAEAGNAAGEGGIHGNLVEVMVKTRIRRVSA